MSIYGKWGWLVAFLFVLCGALRLARYNIQIGLIESTVFNGLPIPAAASVVAPTVIFFSSDYVGVEGKFHNVFILVFVIILSLLMVSNIKYYSFKDMKLLVRKPFTIFFLLIVVSIIIVAEPELMFFVLMLGYALSGPIWWLVKISLRERQKVKEEKK